MSPEVRARQEYSFNTDCWSLGCVLYELIKLERFHDKGIETDDDIKNEITSLLTTELFKKLLRNMLEIDKDIRAISGKLKSLINDN